MSDYETAWDSLCAAIAAPLNKSSTTFDDQDHLTVDQRLKAAEVAALLSISQEISKLNPQNTMSRDDDGTIRNGWGFKTSN